MDDACAECGAPALSSCGRCKLARYCNKDCQRAAWRKHKHTCSIKLRIGKSVSGDGFGCFAREAFTIGEELHREKPLLQWKAVRATRRDATALVQRRMHDAFESLPAASQAVAMGLSDTSLTRAAGDASSLWGVCQTNGIPIGCEDDDESRTPRSALFAVTCRINHSCTPNARYLWRRDLGLELIFALRPLAAGEEVTVGYKTAYAGRAARQATLHRSFNFECTCATCSAPASKASDERRDEIDRLRSQLQEVGFADAPRALEMAERILLVMQAEGLDTPIDVGTVHYASFQLHLASGDAVKAQQHLGQACECARLSEGIGSPLAAKYKAELEELCGCG